MVWMPTENDPLFQAFSDFLDRHLFTNSKKQAMRTLTSAVANYITNNRQKPTGAWLVSHAGKGLGISLALDLAVDIIEKVWDDMTSKNR
jgi:hypothetical protein